MTYEENDISDVLTLKALTFSICCSSNFQVEFYNVLWFDSDRRMMGKGVSIRQNIFPTPLPCPPHSFTHTLHLSFFTLRAFPGSCCMWWVEMHLYLSSFLSVIPLLQWFEMDGSKCFREPRWSGSAGTNRCFKEKKTVLAVFILLCSK